MKDIKILLEKEITDAIGYKTYLHVGVISWE